MHIDGATGAPIADAGDTQRVIGGWLGGVYDEWLRWRTTRQEAQARGYSAGVITALTNRENAVWNVYAALVQAWAAAPP